MKSEILSLIQSLSDLVSMIVIEYVVQLEVCSKLLIAAIIKMS